MTEDIIADGARAPGNRLRLAGYIPLLVFLVMAVFFAIGLTMNPRDIPSPLIGKPVPEFSLPPVKGRTLGLASADLRGQVSLVNVFASWCVACREEHPLLMGLRDKGVVPIHGLNYKDKPDDAQAWLDQLGDPYTRTGADISGRVAIDWGVYGVPETFVIDRDGRIVHKHIGAITPQALRDTIMPIINKLQKS
jgi:cytochrome c biogenesis protein CcmG/thiol:disulfide interchange protein DsbE